MLVQLLGFSHPEDLFRNDLLPDVFRRLWYYVASICFRSTEAFANHLSVPAALSALRREPLLHLMQKQHGMIGEERAQQTMRAQLQGRDLQQLPATGVRPSPMTGSQASTSQQSGRIHPK